MVSGKYVAAGLSLLCLAVFVIVLWVCVDHYYIPSADHIQSRQCTVINCDVDAVSCSYKKCTGTTSDRKCTWKYKTCWDTNIHYRLVTDDGEEYTDTDTTRYSYADRAYDRCDDYPIGSNVTCYYDSRHTSRTLSLSKSGALAGPIATIVIFTICSFIALMLLFASIVNILFF